jgi:hypothetical protein
MCCRITQAPTESLMLLLLSSIRWRESKRPGVVKPARGTYGGSMAQVDPADDSIKRFIVRHYRYDPERRERRHVAVAAFDNEPEYQARMREVGAEIRRRRENAENFDRQEHASGTIYEPGYLRRAANGHLLWRAIRHGVSPPGLEGHALGSFSPDGIRGRPR